MHPISHYSTATHFRNLMRISITSRNELKKKNLFKVDQTEQPVATCDQTFVKLMKSAISNLLPGGSGSLA